MCCRLLGHSWNSATAILHNSTAALLQPAPCPTNLKHSSAHNLVSMHCSPAQLPAAPAAPIAPPRPPTYPPAAMSAAGRRAARPAASPLRSAARASCTARAARAERMAAMPMSRAAARTDTWAEMGGGGGSRVAGKRDGGPVPDPGTSMLGWQQTGVSTAQLEGQAAAGIRCCNLMPQLAATHMAPLSQLRSSACTSETPSLPLRTTPQPPPHPPASR